MGDSMDPTNGYACGEKNTYLRERIALPSAVSANAGNSPGKGVFHFLPLVSCFPGFRVWRFIEIVSPTVVREGIRGS